MATSRYTRAGRPQALRLVVPWVSGKGSFRSPGGSTAERRPPGYRNRGLGRRTPVWQGADGAAEILDFQPVSNGDLPNMIAALPKDKDKRFLMGYYRTEEGDTFHLNAKDVSLAEECFRKPYHVFLMIHSSGFGSPNATFFFHDGDRKMADFAFLEFPLDPSLLVIEERDRIQRSHHAAITHSVEVPSLPRILPLQAAQETKVVFCSKPRGGRFPSLWYSPWELWSITLPSGNALPASAARFSTHPL